MADVQELLTDVPSARWAPTRLAGEEFTQSGGAELSAALTVELTAELSAALTVEEEMAELVAAAALRDRYTSAAAGVSELLERAHDVLLRHSIAALRLTLGLVFLGFGVLKFFPGVSPAENLASTTLDLLSFGLLPAGVGIVVIAALECFIGICLLANRWMRLTLGLLAGELVGILSPIVLLSGRLFSGPHNAPTLEGQYVLKDVILVAAAMVIAAGAFRGGRLVRDEPHPGERASRGPARSGVAELARARRA